MKKQIFEICQLIFDQQQETAAQLQSIERNIQILKQKFTQTMIRQKTYVNNERDIERLFEETYQRDAQIHEDVVKKMREIKDRNVSEKLMHKLSSLNLAQFDSQKETK